MSLETKLMQRLQAAEKEMISIRRHLHRHPENSFHEKETAHYIKQFYQGLDCQVRDCGTVWYHRGYHWRPSRT